MAKKLRRESSQQILADIRALVDKLRKVREEILRETLHRAEQLSCRVPLGRRSTAAADASGE